MTRVRLLEDQFWPWLTGDSNRGKGTGPTDCLAAEGNPWMAIRNQESIQGAGQCTPATRSKTLFRGCRSFVSKHLVEGGHYVCKLVLRGEAENISTDSCRHKQPAAPFAMVFLEAVGADHKKQLNMPSE